MTEVLIVCLCWSVLLASIIPFHHRTYQHVQAALIIKQLKEDVLLTQQLTMHDHVYYWLMFQEDSNDYILYDAKASKSIIHRKLPNNWRMYMNTLKPIVQFNARGMIYQPGTMRIENPYTTYKIVFPFGTSRVRVEKQ